MGIKNDKIVLTEKVMKNLLFLLIMMFSLLGYGQHNSTMYRIAFYNVENLFDVYDDPEKQDDEFLPYGIKGWNYEKYQRKLSHLYKTIVAVGEESKLLCLGLCELENRFVTRQLLENTPLHKFDYQYIQYESPDNRGIDVALVYNPNLLEPLYSEPISIIYDFDTAARTRDILYVKALVLNCDTLHIFVNHWPSRFGGLMETVPKRNFVASVLRKFCDSLLTDNPAANILIMGDLNDDPTDESVRENLKAGSQGDLVNLMHPARWKQERGTLKHGGVWNVFDQIIVSSPMLILENSFSIIGSRAYAAENAFLFCFDEKYPGLKLFRTYSGMQYTGGFGDHLPVFVNLRCNNSK